MRARFIVSMCFCYFLGLLGMMRRLEFPTKKPRDSQPTELLLRFMQGENNPHSIYLLQEVLREEGQKTFQIFLFAELCILCSVGHDSPGGSVFLDEKKLGPAPVSTRLNPMPASYQNLRSCSFKKE